ncbi:MAG: transglutaminase-like domain-containing protein [Desulfobacterales bacterium]
MKPFWILLCLFGLIFAILFSFRLGVFNKFNSVSEELASFSIERVPEKDSWMNILQNGRKIGSSHTTISKMTKGYLLKETLYIRLKTMGLIQDLILKTAGKLNKDFTLSSFDFEISSGRFNFSAQGSVSGNVLSVKTHNFGSTKNIHTKINERIYASSGIVNAAYASGMKPGDEFSLNVFNPVSMSSEPVTIKVIGKENILNMGIQKNSMKVAIQYQGATQLAWIGENGEVIREKGLLGFSLEKTTRKNALFGLLAESSQDLTEIASVKSNIIFENPLKLERIKVEISGINTKDVHIESGRQVLKDNVLIIQKEDLTKLPDVINNMNTIPDRFVKPEPFIESDHPKILNLVEKIVTEDDTPLEKANKLMTWVHKNIEKRPVLSLPDALATLINKVGDCNEHAVLLTALLRAAGIPARIEAGLVYLNGRFYYHAWNLLYIGNWITADSLFGQLPADVTHIRFSSGTMQQQLDIMHIIGKVRLKILIFQ